MMNWTKKSDIKSIFKKILPKFKPGKTVAFVAICLAAVMLVGVSIAWFTSQINLTGSKFSTGTIEVMAYGYDANGNLITSIYPEGKIPEGATDANKPLFDDLDMEAGSVSTVYIAIKNNGSLDLEYRLSFSISEHLNKASDLVYLGGYWYSLNNITDQIAGDGLAAYATAHPAVPCDETDCANGHICSENSNSHNLSELHKYSSGDVIEAGSAGMHYYRMDYGVRASATPNDYSNRYFAVNANIHTSQVGTLDDEAAGYGVTRQVSSATDLDNAIKNSLPGDTIVLMNNITYNGDLVITKCLNFEAGGKVLTVNGNMIYDFVSTLPLTINLQGSGAIKVLSSGAVGGNFTVSAPKSQVELIGGNTAGDLFVSRDLTIDATNAAGSGGCIFSDIVIMDGTGTNPKAMYVRSNTRLTVSAGVSLERIEAAVQATNIEIQNAGQINQIILSSMFMTEQTGAPQIYIHNYNRIFNIILPTWSVPFKVDGEGNCSGNTRIVVSSGGLIDTLTGSAAFDDSHIEDEGADLYVEQIVEGLDTGLRVYYRDLPNETGTSLEAILADYFEGKNITGDALTSAYSAIETLEIICRGDKLVQATDIAFVKGSLKGIVSLDMSQSTINGNSLANNALSNISTLTNVNLPKSLVTLGANAFSGTSIKGITIPATVTSIGDNALLGIKFVYMQSYEPCTISSKGHNTSTFFFVPDSAVDTYRSASVWSGFKDRIYPMAQLADDGVNHVRKLNDGTYEIVNYAGDAAEIEIGNGVTLNGTTLAITSVGENAYRNLTHAFTLKFHSGVKTVSQNAFYGTKVTGMVNFGTVKTIGTSAFENCYYLTVIDEGNSIETLETRAFYNCTRLYQVSLPRIVTVGDSSFYSNTCLVSISFGDGLKSMGSSLLKGSENLRELTFKAPAVSAVVFAETNPIKNIELNAHKNLRIYVSASDYAGYCEKFARVETKNGVRYNFTSTICEDGEKFESNEVGVYYQGTLLGYVELGMFRVRDMGNNSVSISSCTLQASDVSDDSFWSSFNAIPDVIDGKTVVRIGPSAYRVLPFDMFTFSVDEALNPWGNNNATIPETVTEIGDYAFYKTNVSLTTLRNVESIGAYAFSETAKLYYVDAPALTSVGESAFASSTGLRQFKANALTYVDKQAFNSCTELLRLYVRKLSTGAPDWLTYSTNLVELWMATDLDVTLSAADPTEPDYVVYHDTHKRTIIISCCTATDYKVYDYETISPANLTDYTVFDGDNKVLCVLENMAEYWVTEDTSDGRDNTVTILNHFAKTPITSTFNIPAVLTAEISGTDTSVEVVSIGLAAFRGTDFASNGVIVPATLINIGDRAFSTATLAGALNLNNVTNVGRYSFSNSNITSVVGNEVLALNTYTFRYCYSLTSVSLPRLSVLPSHSLRDCTNLQSLYLEDITQFASNSITGSTKLSNITINRVITNNTVPTWGSTSYPAPTYAIQFYVPTQSIALYRASTKYNQYPIHALDEVLINDDGTYYLVNCGDGWELMSFTPVGNPTSIIIPQTHGGKDIITISADAFKQCTSVVDITIPASVSYYQQGVFSGMTALQNVYVATGSAYFSDKGGVLFTANGKELVYYPAYRNATSYTVPEGTKLVQSYAFEGAVILQSVVMNTDLEAIGYKAFDGAGISTITFQGAVPPVLFDGDVFNEGAPGFAISVPAGSVDTYKTASGFVKYKDYIS